MPFVLGAIGLLLLVVLIYTLVQVYRSKPALTLKSTLDLWKPPTSPVVVDRGTVRTQMTGSYSIAMFLRIDSVPDMRAGATPVMVFPGVWKLNYNPATESLVLMILDQIVIIPRFTLQRWNQLTLTLEGRTLDVYVNGKLMTSAHLSNVPPQGTASITVVPENVMGTVALAQVWNRRLTVSDVAANYATMADSQGQPFLGPSILVPLQNLSSLNPASLCLDDSCETATPTASPSQTWEFPYA